MGTIEEYVSREQAMLGSVVPLDPKTQRRAGLRVAAIAQRLCPENPGKAAEEVLAALGLARLRR